MGGCRIFYFSITYFSDQVGHFAQEGEGGAVNHRGIYNLTHLCIYIYIYTIYDSAVHSHRNAKDVFTTELHSRRIMPCCWYILYVTSYCNLTSSIY